MKIIIKSVLTIILCACMLIQTGCWDQKQYEEIGFILQMGFETDPNGKLLMSLTYPVVSEDIEKKVNFLYTSSEKLIRASREKLRDVAGKNLQGGKIQLVYFSKEIARKGINQFFEVFLRDPENPLLANVVIVDGSPKEMMELSLDYKDKPRSAIYMNELLRDARRRLSTPETRIYDFTIYKYAKTIDPVTPLIKYNNKNIEVAGSALFSGDQFVGEIDADQSILLNVLMSKKGEFEYTAHGHILGEGNSIKEGAIILATGNTRKVKINVTEKIPSINITLNIKAHLVENDGEHSLDETRNKEKLEKSIEDQMKNDFLKLIRQLQDAGSDPVGFNEMLRSKKNSYWKTINFKEIYKDIDFKVDVNLNIESYGTIK